MHSTSISPRVPPFAPLGVTYIKLKVASRATKVALFFGQNYGQCLAKKRPIDTYLKIFEAIKTASVVVFF